MFKEVLGFLGKCWHDLSEGAKKRFSFRHAKKGQELPLTNAQRAGLQKKKQAMQQIPKEEMDEEESEEEIAEEELGVEENIGEEETEMAEEEKEELVDSGEEYLGEDEEFEEQQPQKRKKRAALF